MKPEIEYSPAKDGDAWLLSLDCTTKKKRLSNVNYLRFRGRKFIRIRENWNHLEDKLQI